MKVLVKVYATLVKYVGGSIMHESLEVDLSENSTVGDLYDKLGIPRDEVKTTFVNSVIRPPDHTLNEGDEVGVFPPVGGGAASRRRHEMLRISSLANINEAGLR